MTMSPPAPTSTAVGPVTGRAIRVVLFGGGPTIERGAREFICRLEEHPDVEFVGAFCQSQGQSAGTIVRDAWRRRRMLAIPVLGLQFAGWLRARVSPADHRLRHRFAPLAERVHFVRNVHAPDVLERVRDLSPDLGLVYGSPILKPSLFEIPAFGTFGIHHGRMPDYRGKKTTFWEMEQGETSAGVTIQKINAGLDSGEIVKQGRVTIGRKSYGRVWTEVEALGLDLYVEAVLEAKRGEVTLRPTPPGRRKPFRDPKLGDLLRFYSRRIL